MKKIISLLFILLSLSSSAQDNSVPMADGLRQEGKIYVVVLVLAIVFLCLAVYLISIDRKLKKLEDKLTK